MTISAGNAQEGIHASTSRLAAWSAGTGSESRASFVAVSPFRRIVRAINQLRRLSVPHRRAVMNLPPITRQNWCFFGESVVSFASPACSQNLIKLLILLARPTRFERVTFAFGGQFPGFAGACYSFFPL
jgi:hypothetical protein